MVGFDTSESVAVIPEEKIGDPNLDAACTGTAHIDQFG